MKNRRFTEEELAKLPKWARLKIASLQGAYDKFKKHLESTHPYSPICIEMFENGEFHKHRLPHETIRFEVGSGWFDVNIGSVYNKNKPKQWLRISGSTSLLAKLGASNLIELKLEGE
jgi:hypothetical protein